MTENPLDRLVKHVKNIPALPANIQRINTIIDKHQLSLTEIGREISQDQALSAQVLRLINSSFYGMSQSVSSIPHAVVLLGLKTVRVLVTSSFASGLIEKSMPGLYDHSVACARACDLIARRISFDNPDEMATIGLLHDIGKVILAENLQEQFQQVQEKVRKEDVLFAEAERELLGATHGDLAAWLLHKWNLPDSTITAIQFHHAEALPEDSIEPTAILILADLLVRAGRFGWPGDGALPAVAPSVPESLDLSPGDLKDLMKTILIELNDIPRCRDGLSA